MTAQRQNKYDSRNILTMESVYGPGFMSPGGPSEVIRIFADIDPPPARILDLGCGAGGASIALAGRFTSAHITALDIEPSVLERARELIDEGEFGDRIDLELGVPGALAFTEQSFDSVYANSTTCHIEDLREFFTEIYRVLKPGGVFLGAEWFVGDKSEVFEVWDNLLRSNGLNFYFVKPEQFSLAIGQSGFETALYRDRSESIAALASNGLAQVEGALRESLVEVMGETGYATFLNWTRERTRVLHEHGMSHCHFHARRV